MYSKNLLFISLLSIFMGPHIRMHSSAFDGISGFNQYLNEKNLSLQLAGISLETLLSNSDMIPVGGSLTLLIAALVLPVF